MEGTRLPQRLSRGRFYPRKLVRGVQRPRIDAAAHPDTRDIRDDAVVAVVIPRPVLAGHSGDPPLQAHPPTGVVTVRDVAPILLQRPEANVLCSSRAPKRVRGQDRCDSEYRRGWASLLPGDQA